MINSTTDGLITTYEGEFGEYVEKLVDYYNRLGSTIRDHEDELVFKALTQFLYDINRFDHI